MATILVVEDEDSARCFLRILLSREGHTAVEAGDGVEALKVLQTISFDLLIINYRMPRMGGLELLGSFIPPGREEFQPFPSPVVGRRCNSFVGPQLGERLDLLSRGAARRSHQREE